MKLVTAGQMRAVEQRAVQSGVSIPELMEAAGRAVAQEAWLALGLTPGRRVLVLVGPGNNGGDGLVAARHLAEWEADVAVYLLAARPDSDENLGRVRELGIPVFLYERAATRPDHRLLRGGTVGGPRGFARAS